ncbi:MAG: integrase [Dehalococcoidia bacterium]|nr:integrase [Dehalococcoidia bacterium]
MNDERLQTIEKVKQFLAGSEALDFGGVSVEERYQWMQTVLVKFKYYQLKRAEKGVIRRYIEKVSGYSRAQVSRLIREYARRGRLRKARYKRHRFPRRYTTADIALLARTDELHDYLSGPSTKKIMEREWELYGHSGFRNISRISVAHLYNMRRSPLYRSINTRYAKTKPSVVKIAERAKPEPGGSPGHIRTDTVHQGDLNGKKGVYHINAVDEVTQWEIIASVERISESYLMPVLESMLGGFPFVIKGFHSDNGSEFINKVVAELLNKLLIRFTKSRPRHTNDNGLVESKNGSVVRKHLGYEYIPQACAEALNQFNSDFLNPYINFHRPCFFPVSVTDHRGKVKKTYPYQEVMTPYEKFKSLPEAEAYLRPGVTMAKLDDIASQMSDNEFAERMVKARSNLFQNISRGEQRVAVGCVLSTTPVTCHRKKVSHKERSRIPVSPGSFFD